MQDRHRQEAYEVTWLVRRIFRALAARADRYLAESGLTAADREVLEFLYPETALSVPEIARRYQVSRQHVQVTVNGLLERGLVRRIDNPRHKRSRLIRLSTPGRESFDRIRQVEARIIDELFTDVAQADLQTTLATLQLLYRNLNRGETE